MLPKTRIERISPNAAQRFLETCFLRIMFQMVRAITMAVQAVSRTGDNKRSAPEPWASEKPTIWGPRSQVHTVSSQIRRPNGIAVPTKKITPVTLVHSGSRAIATGDTGDCTPSIGVSILKSQAPLKFDLAATADSSRSRMCCVGLVSGQASAFRRPVDKKWRLETSFGKELFRAHIPTSSVR